MLVADVTHVLSPFEDFLCGHHDRYRRSGNNANFLIIARLFEIGFVAHASELA